MQDGEWMGWAARDVEIYRDDAVEVTNNLITAIKRAAGNCAGTTGNDDLRVGNCLIGRNGRGPHVFGNGAGDMDTISMARGSNELNSESGEIEKRGIQYVGISLAGIAACCRNLPELQGTAKELFEMLFGMVGQSGQVSVGYEIITACRSHFKIWAEGGKFPLRHSLAQATEYAAAQVDTTCFLVNGVLRTSICTAFYKGCFTLRIDLGKAAEPFVQVNGFFGIFRSPISLFYTIFYNF